MDQQTPERPERTRPISKANRDRLARRAARLWGYVTLSGISTLALLVIWHLVRRGRLLQSRTTPVRIVRLSEIVPDRPLEKPPAPPS